MQMLKKYQQLTSEFLEVADFAVVYIEEAHPVDGWAFKVTKKFFHFFFRVQLIAFILVCLKSRLFEKS